MEAQETPISKPDRQEARDLLEKVRQKARLSHISVLEEVHPGWILEKLEGESPRILGLLCRFLSGEKAKYLIEHLPISERPFLPKINETYRVPHPIVDVVRCSLEKKFSIPPFPPDSNRFSFQHIAWMKTDDLKTLFWDLGLEEIRKAFSQVEPQVLRAFLARFSPQLAKEIRERLEFGKPVAPETKREAQKHLVALSLGQHPVEDLLREIGYSVFAQSLSPEDLSGAEFLVQKLSPQEGHRFKRILKQNVQKKNPKILEEKREEILGRISLLGEKGLIRRYWKEKR